MFVIYEFKTIFDLNYLVSLLTRGLTLLPNKGINYLSKLFDKYYKGVGDIGADIQIVEDLKERFQKGVMYCLRDNRICSVWFWNLQKS
jgi:hypothetical protein